MKPVSYEIEELLPLVAKLAFKYTSGESSSVSYETANMLMEAVCYCIGENEWEDGRDALEGSGAIKLGRAAISSGAIKVSGSGSAWILRKSRNMTAAESYRQGFEKVLEKTRRTQERYNEMIADFRAYGNENYRDTVLKALPEFFMKYDPRFAPQETIIGMDYPTLLTVSEETGIDGVERYVSYISLEQRFFRKLPEGMAEELLTRFHEEYREQFFNLGSIPLRHMLAAALLGRQPGREFSDQEYAALREFCAGRDRENLTEILNRLTEKLVESGWGQDKELLGYLQGDTENFAAGLAEGAKWNVLRNVVV